MNNNNRSAIWTISERYVLPGCDYVVPQNCCCWGVHRKTDSMEIRVHTTENEQNDQMQCSNDFWWPFVKPWASERADISYWKHVPVPPPYGHQWQTANADNLILTVQASFVFLLWWPESPAPPVHWWAWAAFESMTLICWYQNQYNCWWHPGQL